MSFSQETKSPETGKASRRERFDRAEALDVARELCHALKPVSERLIVGGSLRRRKEEVGDVEIVYVPKIELSVNPPVDLFEENVIEANLAERVIFVMEAKSILSRRLNANGAETFGPMNKLMRHTLSGIPVDLFATTNEKWWVSVVIRTGSKETNLALTTGARRMGRTLHAYGSGVTVLETGEEIPAISEQHVFELCGVPYLEPWER